MKIRVNRYVELLLLATAVGGIAVRQWLIPSLTWQVQALLFLLSFGVLNVVWAFHFQFNEWLNHRLPFEKNVRWRVIVQVFGGWSVVKTLFLIVSYFVSRYFLPPTLSLLGNYTFLIIGIMVFLVNTVICLGFMASHLLKRWQENALQTAQLEKEKVQVQLDSLKNQISPHFLFNSLSSLDSLIDDNPVLARQFLQQLSKVFRYVLQHKEKSLVPLETELAFIKNYISLLHTRFDGTFAVICQVDDTALDQQIVPVTLQILIENAIKHNVISESHPLTVTISTHDGYITVSNPIQRKRQVGTSNGQGLENLKLLYSYLGPKPIDVGDTGETFRVQVPLLEGE
ncbi:sensor histidine kinase [Spirosoma spitsbergense]|uniref:sensor histidine kinase n=1 Tax=Spirosoma spitsbergense TaxID=431554 RepID=UPI000365E198|nr:histidine kinase [Spirosoma spitsbergense]